MAWISLNRSVFIPVYNGPARLAPTQHDRLWSCIQRPSPSEILPHDTACAWIVWRLDRWQPSPQHIELQIWTTNLCAETCKTRRNWFRIDDTIEKTLSHTRIESRKTLEFTYWEFWGGGRCWDPDGALRYWSEGWRILGDRQNWVNHGNRAPEEWILPWWNDWSKVNLWQQKLQKCGKSIQNKVGEKFPSLWLLRKD